MGERFLVVIGTQRVKGFLFASPILRETRGASLLLDRLNRQRTRDLLRARGGTEIYLGGGSGTALFETLEAAQRFRAEVAAVYRQEAPMARVSIQVLERQDESFTRWVARGVGESKRNKLARAEAFSLLGGRWLRPCTSCGREPAERIPPPDVQGEHRLCRACHAKREQIRSFYRDAKGDLDRRIPIPTAAELQDCWPDYVLTTLAGEVEKRYGNDVRTLLPKDFDDLGERSRPRNYFALIYADGNRMGETIRTMGDLFPGDLEARQAYRAFSRIVDQSTREAAAAAVLDAGLGTEEMRTEDGRPARLVAAEFAIAGGDDLILVVPAQAALEVAERFITRFHETSRELQDQAIADGELAQRFAPEGLTTSAGVVIAHASYPASQLVELAAELMKSAKRRAADPRLNPGGEGTLDFMVVHESGTESLKVRRAEYVDRHPSGFTVYRTERPYTARESAELRARILALQRSEVPRSKLEALYAALFRSPVEAQYEAARLRERLLETGSVKRSAALQKLLADLPLFPFREKDGGWSTPLSELIEIYDLIHDEGAPAADLEETRA